MYDCRKDFHNQYVEVLSINFINILIESFLRKGITPDNGHTYSLHKSLRYKLSTKIFKFIR